MLQTAMTTNAQPRIDLVPVHLTADAVVSRNEPSLSISDLEVREHLRKRMTFEQIKAEIDAIGNLAVAREAFGCFGLLGIEVQHRAYACINSGINLQSWLHQHELHRLNQLQIADLTAAEEAELARERILARRAARKNQSALQAA